MICLMDGADEIWRELIVNPRHGADIVVESCVPLRQRIIAVAMMSRTPRLIDSRLKEFLDIFSND